ncbi:MAG: hypothetical protein AAFN70_06150, partial [Planctomycetota bacterium]
EQLNVNFDLTSLQPGLFDIVVTENGETSELLDAFTVNAEAQNFIEAQITIPERIAVGRTGTAIVDYRNTGDAQTLAPLLVISSLEDNVEFALPGRDFSNATLNVLGISNVGDAGVLAPGEQGSFEVQFRVLNQSGEFQIDLDVLGETDAQADEPIDWPAQKDALRPTFITPDAWDVIYDNFLDSVGTTGRDTLQAFSAAANHIGSIGGNAAAFDELLALQIQDAEGFEILSHLHVGIDVVDATPGTDLVFGRRFTGRISERHETGILGRGWSHFWQRSVTLDAAGNATVELGMNATTIFNAAPGGQFKRTPDTNLRLERGADNSFVLTDPGGTVTTFDSAGQLVSVTDRNGNTTTAVFGNGLLIGLQHSSGKSLTLAYNAASLLESVTDSAGRRSTYQYDATDEFLTSATDSNGRTTTFTYESDTNAKNRFALLSVSLDEGVNETFRYDAGGRLNQIEFSNGETNTVFDRSGMGTVRFDSDDGGPSQEFFYDTDGFAVKTIDEQGRTQRLKRENPDENVLPSEFEDGLGRGTQIEFDDANNIVAIINGPATTRFKYDDSPSRNLIASIDPAGTRIEYQYDAAGNPSGRSFVDGTSESFTYDENGSLVTAVNRRSQIVQFEHDSSGRVTEKQYLGDETFSFEYDTSGNLIRAESDAGAVSRQYDGADNLIRIDYPGGQFLEYQYDALGRRTQIKDHLGNELNSFYNDRDLMSRLTDQNGDVVVEFEFDNLNRPTR